MTPSSVFVAKVKSKFGTRAVVDNKKIVTAAVMRDKAIIGGQCRGVRHEGAADFAAVYVSQSLDFRVKAI